MLLIRHGQSAFNVVFSETRVDPGIVDPELTPLGREQARGIADAVRDHGVQRLVVSPYTRALQTAEEILRVVDLPVTVNPLIRERMAFACDIGTHASRLADRWPGHVFHHLDEQWWPAEEEPETSVIARCETFRQQARNWSDWRRVGVVTHWGFIKGLTGQRLGNCETVVYDPATPVAHPTGEAIPGQSAVPHP